MVVHVKVRYVTIIYNTLRKLCKYILLLIDTYCIFERMFDYEKNIFHHKNKSYNLDLFRVWMLENHPEIVLAHRIKKIYRQGTYEWTFDWDTIFFKTNFIKDFINEYQ